MWVGPARRSWQTLGFIFVALVTLALVAVSVSSLIPSSVIAKAKNPRLGIDQPAPYAQVPATATPVDDIVHLGDLDGQATAYPPNGEIYFVTISRPPQSLLSWSLGRDDGAVKFITTEDRFGYQPPGQERSLSLAMMRTSQQVAEYVAVTRLGFDAEILPGEVIVQDIVCLKPNEAGDECLEWSPADKELDPGDEITAVDGTSIGSVEELSGLLANHKPGDKIEMDIVREGEPQTIEVELTSSPDDPNRTIIGFYPFDTRRVELPFEMSIDASGVGGPSAGLAFALTIADELSPGDLVGTGKVAVTGTINLDGSVGAIGGLVQKASAVQQAGVRYFLVPTAQGDDQIDQARAVVGDDVTIIPVATFDEAVDQLVKLGGDPLPPKP